MSVFPESQGITYQDSQGRLKSTSFISEVRYQREITFISDDFWLRRMITDRPEGGKKNCEISNAVASNSPVISSIREEVFAWGNNHELTSYVDSMQLDFDVSEGACELIPYDKAENFDVIEKDEKVLSLDISFLNTPQKQ